MPRIRPQVQQCVDVLAQSYNARTYLYAFFSVSAFSLSNVKDLSLVHVVVDADLLNVDATELIAFHPATSDKTTFISATELKSYLDSLGKEYKVLNFKELAAAAPAAAPKAAAKPAKAAKAAPAGNKSLFIHRTPSPSFRNGQD